ncbi:hypothetical protein [Microbulbifer sp. TYP-18]|uniref:hypothetical protein n=1 Tax=Microbulbifer sp. TYP-18 TaxID=3230024 RepID=UPI0034C5E37D
MSESSICANCAAHTGPAQAHAGFPPAALETEDLLWPQGEEILEEVDDAETVLWPIPGINRCSFREQQPGRDGVGPYHINTHIAFFRPPAGFDLNTACDRLFRRFPAVFSPGNLARAEFSNCRFNGKRTVKFTLNEFVGNLRDDWVAMDKKRYNFVATTLERQWYELLEAAAHSGSVVGAPGIGTLFGRIAVDINRRHFLAGRRSWTLGRLPNGLHFIETAAFERYSHQAFMAMEGPAGMRSKILEIWTNLLRNYVHSVGGHLDAYLPAGYRHHRGVCHRESQSSNPRALRGGWFARVLRRHPGL